MIDRKPAILVVDDDMDIHKLFEPAFESAGFEYHSATTAAQGLEMVKSKQFSLAVVDGALPDYSGLELCRRIRADRGLCALPLIFLSSYFRETSVLMELYVLLKVRVILHKPQRIEDMILHVSRLVAPESMPTSGSFAFDRAFVEIREMYIESFFEQLQNIEKTIDTLSADPASRGTLENLRTYVHRIHGSAGTYGYTLVSYTAGRWEEELDSILKNTIPSTQETIKRFKNNFDKIKLDFQAPDDLLLFIPANGK
jgi:CheY-like chemotaxis protein/HPt (histidine-containing phosphotransfer) domain-containing protein